jgi:hypothetical protein
VKVTSIPHVELTSRLVPQVVPETAKSPVVETVMLVSATASRLVRVNCRARRIVWAWTD